MRGWRRRVLIICQEQQSMPSRMTATLDSVTTMERILKLTELKQSPNQGSERLVTANNSVALIDRCHFRRCLNFDQWIRQTAVIEPWLAVVLPRRNLLCQWYIIASGDKDPSKTCISSHGSTWRQGSKFPYILIRCWVGIDVFCYGQQHRLIVHCANKVYDLTKEKYLPAPILIALSSQT